MRRPGDDERQGLKIGVSPEQGDEREEAVVDDAGGKEWDRVAWQHPQHAVHLDGLEGHPLPSWTRRDRGSAPPSADLAISTRSPVSRVMRCVSRAHLPPVSGRAAPRTGGDRGGETDDHSGDGGQNGEQGLL